MAYPPVVAGGSSATIIHYGNNDKVGSYCCNTPSQEAMTSPALPFPLHQLQYTTIVLF